MFLLAKFLFKSFSRLIQRLTESYRDRYTITKRISYSWGKFLNIFSEINGENKLKLF